MPAFEGLSSEAATVHHALLRDSTNSAEIKFYNQDEVKKFSPNSTPEQIVGMMQELLNHRLVAVASRGTDVVFQPIDPQEAEMIKGMSQDEHLVYTCIQAAGRDGVWTKSIRAKTQLHQTVVSRCLKSLENSRQIKSIKSVKHPTRKIYMLYHLEPSAELTGGPWFTDSEMDSEFIETLLMVVWKFIASRTFPAVFNEADPSKPQQSYPVGHVDYPTVEQVHQFVIDSKIVQGTPIAVPDIRHLCEVLVYDDRLERVHLGRAYRATWASVVAEGGGPTKETITQPLTETACGACPVFNVCDPSGPVNPGSCVYYDEWLST